MMTTRFRRLLPRLCCILPMLILLPSAALAESDASASPVPSIFTGLFELKWYTAAILIALIAMGIALYAGSRRTRWDSRRIANAAMCIAIAYVLSCIKVYKFPQGGSITPASMLPIVAFAVACGPLQGAIAGCAYGLLGLIQDPYIIHPVQMLVDYPLAFGALALGGLVQFIPLRKELKLPAAILIGGIGRYAMAVLSGTVFFSEYAPVGQSALVYSLAYNISYLGPDVLICMLIAAVPGIYRIIPMIRGNVQSTR